METHYYFEYDKQVETHWWFVGRRKILSCLLHSKIFPNGLSRVLDIGTGNGSQLRLFDHCCHILGLDCNTSTLDLARLKRGVHFVQADALAIPTTDGAFDLVSCLDVLEHLEDDYSALKESQRVCRKGGFLLVTVPAYQFLWSDHDEINHHQRRYSRGQLAKMIHETGWEIVKISYFNSLLFPLIAVARTCLPKTRTNTSSRDELKSDFVHSFPRPVNWLLTQLFSAEGWFLPYLNLPFGCSLVCIARRR